MADIRIRAVREPLAAPVLARKAVTTIGRAAAMGLLPEAEVVETLDLDSLGRVAGYVARAGIAPAALAELRAWRGGDPARLGAILDELGEALAASPVPEHEWPEVIRVLEEPRLAKLLGISGSSLRRYASGERETPDDVAARLHHIALVVGNLSGTYNAIGTRRWFDRKRARLANRSPAQVLRGRWQPEDKGPSGVLELSASLLGSPAT